MGGVNLRDARNAKYNVQKCGKCVNAKNAKIRHVAPSQLKFRLLSVFVVAIFVGRGVVIRCGVFIFFVGICGSRIF